MVECHVFQYIASIMFSANTLSFSDKVFIAAHYFRYIIPFLSALSQAFPANLASDSPDTELIAI